MSESIDRTRRALARELKEAEGHVVKLRKALAAITALDGRGTGQKYMAKKRLVACACGTKFHAVRSDARFCLECKRKRAAKRMRTTKPKGKPKGVTLMKNTPSAKK